MTAEIVVANKIGIALAADSTITIRSSAGDKTYNTANKIFTVHKVHPVAALVYGATMLNGIPIEVIIKEFRRSLPDTERDTLAEYADEFMDFLRKSVPIKPADHAENFRAVVQEYSRRLQTDMRRAVVDRPIRVTDTTAVRGVMREFIQDFGAQVKSAGPCSSFIGIDRATLEAAYPNVVEETVNRMFRLFSPTNTTRRNIVDLIYDACLSNELTYNRMGLVIAGYGRDEYYPSFKSFETDGFFAGHLKIVATSALEVTNDNESFVHPFAQSELTALFMEGVDPVYQEYVNDQTKELIGGLAEITGRFFGSADRQKIGRLRRTLANLARDMVADFEKRRWEWFVQRTLDAVDFLDKSELAALAESLVSLAALRQKVSLDMETVGGPVDVAIISKGDGFIWIKRKYYFEGEMNPFYFQRYLR